jgi:hypothetical protein
VPSKRRGVQNNAAGILGEDDPALGGFTGLIMGFSMSVDTEGMKPAKRFTELSKRSGFLATHRKSVHPISFKTQRRSL